MARPLDGHVNRVLEGKTVERAVKDGKMLILEMTNGERWGIAMVDPESGEGVAGEPCIVKVDVRIQLAGVSVFGEGAEL